MAGRIKSGIIVSKEIFVNKSQPLYFQINISFFKNFS